MTDLVSLKRSILTEKERLEKLDQIIDLLPGAEKPTILPLAGSDDHVAVHAVARETVFWETMESLKALGGSSILVLPIEKMLG